MTISSPSKDLEFLEQDLGKLNAAKEFANESRLLGALLSRGYNASRVNFPHSTYDIIVEVEQDEISDIIRVQVKTVSQSGSISFVGGIRSGIDRSCKSSEKEYVQSTNTSDVIVGVLVSGDNGESRIDYYFVPTIYVEHINQKSKSANLLEDTKNNWTLFKNCKNRSFVSDFFELGI